MLQYWGNSYAFGRLWTPAQIATNLWLDAADASTITSSSSLVSQWNDKSGNTRNATASGSARPTYSATSFNGRAGIVFDGSNNMIFNSVNTIRTCIALFSWSATTGSFRVMLGDSGGPQSTYDFHGEEAVAGAPLFSSQYASPYVINGSKWINGTQQSAGSLLSRYTSPTIQIIQTTDFVRASNFGDRDVANRYFLGSYAELILVGSILTSSDLQKIEGYLAHKWGLTAGLPASHPYKSAAPTVPSLP